MNKIVIVGGGAAGMMAAIHAAREGAEVTLFEKNEKLGKKLFITGKGRCNLTNACDMEDFFGNIISNEKFLYSALYSFDNEMAMQFFAGLGLKLKTERGERVFPVSDHSSDVIRVLEKELNRQSVRVYQNTAVDSLLLSEDGQERCVCGVRLEDGREFSADRVLLATGGVSYPSTGSTGDGHRMAREAGHRVTELYPALVPLYVKEEWCRKLTGLSLRNVLVTIKDGKRILFQEFGEMLFTHFGVSGPLILSASSFLTKKLAGGFKELLMEIDLKPALSEKQLDQRLIREFEQNSKKHFKNILPSLFPSKLVPVMAELSGIDPSLSAGEISKKQRTSFGTLIKHLPVTLVKTAGFQEAIITQGGVSVKEVNPKTMESKLIRNLYLAGEILDVDALTGGFNLQLAWSTAVLAGKAMAQ